MKASGVFRGIMVVQEKMSSFALKVRTRNPLHAPSATQLRDVAAGVPRVLLIWRQST